MNADGVAADHGRPIPDRFGRDVRHLSGRSRPAPHAIVASHAGSSSQYGPTSDADVAARLARRFDAASASRSGAALLALRDAAVEFVGRLKWQGLPAERVIVALKAQQRGHGPEGWTPSLDAGRGTPWALGARTVHVDLFGWCVEAYFGEALHGLLCGSGDVLPAVAPADALHTRAPWPRTRGDAARSVACSEVRILASRTE